MLFETSKVVPLKIIVTLVLSKPFESYILLRAGSAYNGDRVT